MRGDKLIAKLRRDPRVLRVEGDEDGYWVYLRPGYWDGDMGCHAIRADTLTDLAERVRLNVVECSCDACDTFIAENG